MIEFDVDMERLLEEQSLDCVVLNDENGEHEPIKFMPKSNCIRSKVHVSEETILDEAIAEAKASEDWQLAEWLRAARGSFDSARWFTKKIDELKAENEQLQKDIEDLESYDQVLRDKLRQETELRVKAEAENKQLRELRNW